MRQPFGAPPETLLSRARRRRESWVYLQKLPQCCEEGVELIMVKPVPRLLEYEIPMSAEVS